MRRLCSSHRLQDAVGSFGMALSLDLSFPSRSPVPLPPPPFTYPDVSFCGASHLAHSITTHCFHCIKSIHGPANPQALYLIVLGHTHVIKFRISVNDVKLVTV